MDSALLRGRTFIDLFAGMGGFWLAFESLGAKCVYSSEWDAEAQHTYEINFGEVPAGDITKVDENSIPDHDILCAGFPCQAFSISGKLLGFEDSRGTLFFDIARIVKAKRPAVIFLENVKNLRAHDAGRTFKVIQNTLEELGYNVYHKVLSAVDYDVPQIRERIYIVCFRADLNIQSFQFPEPIPLMTFVEHCLLPDSEIPAELYLKHEGKFRLVSKLDDVYCEEPVRLGYINSGCQGERIYSPKGVAITLSAYGGGKFAKTGGYYINKRCRRLHPRECARLMGYPDTYILPENFNTAYQQLGNSVVVDVLQYIGVAIAEVLSV